MVWYPLFSRQNSMPPRGRSPPATKDVLVRELPFWFLVAIDITPAKTNMTMGNPYSK